MPNNATTDSVETSVAVSGDNNFGELVFTQPGTYVYTIMTKPIITRPRIRQPEARFIKAIPIVLYLLPAGLHPRDSRGVDREIPRVLQLLGA